MSEVDIAREKMNFSIKNFEQALGQIRTSGANPNLIANVEIDYYGMATPINQLSSISVIE